MDVLVGSTGLIGSVLQDHHHFDHCYSSRTIHRARLLQGTIDKLFLACLPATKWQANKDPLRDFANMQLVIEDIKHWQCREVVLYSTIDIFGNGKDVFELPKIEKINYGTTRRMFELLVQEAFKDAKVKIIRLPALFHNYIKKNILFDLLNNNELHNVNIDSAFQWYDLSDLWFDTEAATDGYNNWFSEPVETKEIIERFFPRARVGIGPRQEYNIGPYFSSKEEIMKKMEVFVHAYRN